MREQDRILFNVMYREKLLQLAGHMIPMYRYVYEHRAITKNDVLKWAKDHDDTNINIMNWRMKAANYIWNSVHPPTMYDVT